MRNLNTTKKMPLVFALGLTAVFVVGCSKFGSKGESSDASSILGAKVRLTGLAPGKSISLRLTQGTAVVSETQLKKDGEFLLGQVDTNLPYDVTLTDQSTDPNCATSRDQANNQLFDIRFLVQCHSLAFLTGDMGGPGNMDGPIATARFYEPLDVAFDAGGNLLVSDFGNRTIRKITQEGIVSTLLDASVTSDGQNGALAKMRFYSANSIVTDANGNLYVADEWDYTVRKVDVSGVMTILAGASGKSGSLDGSGSDARFQLIKGITIDGDGNIYVSENFYHTIRKITPQGVVTTFAGTAKLSGSTDGVGSAALFKNPSGIVPDTNGNLFVVDAGNCTIRKITQNAEVTTWAGEAGQCSHMDGAAGFAHFSSPRDIAMDLSGNFYITELDNTIRKIDPEGNVSTLAGAPGKSGDEDGIGFAARFNDPQGLTTDATGNVYVADFNNNAIRKISPEGLVTTLGGTANLLDTLDTNNYVTSYGAVNGIVFDEQGNLYIAGDLSHSVRKISPGGMVTTIAGNASQSGSKDGTGSEASFYLPQGIARDRVGNLYVTDRNHTVRKITPGGVVTTLAGMAGLQGSADGPGDQARFSYPMGIAVDANGNVFVADNGNSTIRKITPTGVVTTLAGQAHSNGTADGRGGSARFFFPEGLAADAQGNLYVADNLKRTIRKVTPSGDVSTLINPSKLVFTPNGIATDAQGNLYVTDSMYKAVYKIAPDGELKMWGGEYGVGAREDGMGLAARFKNPWGVAVDAIGNIYVSEPDAIRKISPDGLVTTFVVFDFRLAKSDGTALLLAPNGITADAHGNIFVADSVNRVIRRVALDGGVTTLAGQLGYTGSDAADGVGNTAQFYRPQGIAMDASGNVYVTDENQTIRKITPQGVVTTLAGSAFRHEIVRDGLGSDARFSNPKGIAVDAHGTVFVTDGHGIRKITADGTVTTLAGIVDQKGDADGEGSEARFNAPEGIAADNNGNLYVADTYNHTIRKIDPQGWVTTVAGVSGQAGFIDGFGSAVRIAYPGGLTIDSNGNLYIEGSCCAIRKMTPDGIVSAVVGKMGVGGFSAGALPGILGWTKGIAVVGTTMYITLYNGVAAVYGLP